MHDRAAGPAGAMKSAAAIASEMIILLNIDLRIAQVRPRVEESVQRVLATCFTTWAYSPITVRYACDRGWNLRSRLEHRRNSRASLVLRNGLVDLFGNNRSRGLFRYEHRRHCFPHDLFLSNVAPLAGSHRSIFRLHCVGRNKFDRVFWWTGFAARMASAVWCRPDSNRNKKTVRQAGRSHTTRKYWNARRCHCHVREWSGQHRHLHAVVCDKQCAPRNSPNRRSLRASGCVVRCRVCDSSPASGRLYSATLGTLGRASGSRRPWNLYPIALTTQLSHDRSAPSYSYSCFLLVWRSGIAVTSMRCFRSAFATGLWSIAKAFEVATNMLVVIIESSEI